jgi:HSP20 family protein
MFYHYSPLHDYPALRYWTPYTIAATPTSCSFFSGNENKSENDNDQVLNKLYRDRRVHVQQKDNIIVFSLDLPGIKSSDATVEIRDGVLSVHAQRNTGANVSAKYVQHFFLKDSSADDENIRANLIDGVLTITVPKKEELKPFPVTVTAEYPPTKAEDNAKDVRFSIDLPGVKASDVNLEYTEGTITLHAESKVLERVSTIDKYFSIDRTKVDATAFKAYLVDGVLTITGYLKDASELKLIAFTDGSTPAKAEEEKNGDDKMIVETVTDEK